MRRILLIFALFTILSAVSYAQTPKTITGRVTDSATGEPLIGATVREAGTANITKTDLDGRYSLSVKSDKIVVSYVGYATSQITASDAGVYDIRLTGDNMMNEIVVVGYGTQRRSDLTGSLSSVSGKDIKNQATSNVSNMLAGKAAGVYVSTSSGQPGDDAVVREVEDRTVSRLCGRTGHHPHHIIQAYQRTPEPGVRP